jgi:Na+-driven multidrug efflux pump
VSAGVGLLFVVIPIPLLGIFGATEGNVAEIGRQLLRYLAVSGFFISAALTFTGGLQGTGDTKGPLYITLVSQIVVPLGLCAVLQSLRQLQPGDIWLAIVLGHFTRCALSYLRFKQGKWREIKVELEPAQPAAVS